MKILYFAPLPFNDLKQRPQQIAEELSKKHEIWYIEPTISYISAFIKKNKDYRAKNYDFTTMLHVVRLSGIFALPIRFQLFDPLFLNTVYEKHQLKQLLRKCDIVWIGYEVWKRLISKNSQYLLVYDKMDDNLQLTQQHMIKKVLQKSETRLLMDSDIIFVTAQRFFNDFRLLKKNVYLVPNGIGFEQNVMTPSIRVKTAKKLFGYIGKISHWFDVQAIRVIALTNPECEVALIGPNDQPVIDMPNVKYYGTVPKYEIPSWIECFDVCLYPFKQGDLLDTIDPVKIYEYLALNKPVIAVNSYEMKKYGSLIYTYSNYSELESLSQKKLPTPFRNELEKNEFLENNSWKNRVNKIEQILVSAKEIHV